MKIGMVSQGRTGSNKVHRLPRAGHEYDVSGPAVVQLVNEGAGARLRCRRSSPDSRRHERCG
jgi:hypothetical protein